MKRPPQSQRRSLPTYSGVGMHRLESGATIRYSTPRSSPRVRPSPPLFVDCPERKPIRDISLAGAYIEHDQPPPQGQLLQLRIWLGDIEPVVIQAEIQRSDEGRGMGVKFLRMRSLDYEHLREFLSSAHP